MIDKSVFRKNEAFERENFSLAFKIARRRRAIFFAVGALRGVPARRGSECHRENPAFAGMTWGWSEGEASPTKIIFRKNSRVY